MFSLSLFPLPFLFLSFPLFPLFLSFLPVFPFPFSFSLFLPPVSPFSPCFSFYRVLIPFSCSMLPIGPLSYSFPFSVFPFCVSALSFLFPCFARRLFSLPRICSIFYDAFPIGTFRVCLASAPHLSDWIWISDVEFQYLSILSILFV